MTCVSRYFLSVFAIACCDKNVCLGGFESITIFLSVYSIHIHWISMPAPHLSTTQTDSVTNAGSLLSVWLRFWLKSLIKII
mgnify:FL=1